MSNETKANLSEPSIDHLQELIRMNIDSSDGFDYAADQLESTHTDLSNQFRGFSSERASFARELQAIVERNDEAPVERGSLAASLHRTWMGTREMFGDKMDIHAIVAEAERGEDYIKEAYETALEALAGGPLTETLRRQYAAVCRSHDLVRDLRDQS